MDVYQRRLMHLQLQMEQKEIEMGSHYNPQEGNMKYLVAKNIYIPESAIDHAVKRQDQVTVTTTSGFQVLITAYEWLMFMSDDYDEE